MQAENDGIPFQFHKGTIKTLYRMITTRQCLYFNSIKVRLKPSKDIHDVVIYSNFNSIKVRLKPPSLLTCKAMTAISIP